jgi:hypothetical protein
MPTIDTARRILEDCMPTTTETARRFAVVVGRFAVVRTVSMVDNPQRHRICMEALYAN